VFSQFATVAASRIVENCSGRGSIRDCNRVTFVLRWRRIIFIPAGIDEAIDGSAVYVVSPYFSYITTIDPNLLEVVQQTNIPSPGSGQYAYGFQLVTLSNGDVLFLSDQSSTVGTVYLWNPATDVFTSLNQPALQNLSEITRTADHSKAPIYSGNSSGSTGVVYDASTGSLTGPVTLSGVYALAINPNGSQILGVGLQGLPTIFYDSQCQLSIRSRFRFWQPVR
jgi:hypothetical protein